MAGSPRRLDIGAASVPKRPAGGGIAKQGEVKLEVPASPVGARKLSKPSLYEKDLQSSFWDSEPVWM